MVLPESTLRILRSLRDGPKQAREVASEMGMETSSVYRQLEALRARGFVRSTEVIQGRGRPKKVYSLTPEGYETFPRDYAFLLSALLREIVVQSGRETLSRYLEGIAAEVTASFSGETNDRLRALVDLYNRLGFEASLERDESGVILVQRNCPFLKVARGDPEALCLGLDEALMRRALPEGIVTLRETLAKGDLRCRHSIRWKPRGEPESDVELPSRTQPPS